MEQRFSDLLILLASGINQRRMYFDRHPRVQALSHDFVAKFNAMIAVTEPAEFSFGVYNSKFIRDGKYLVGPSIAGRSLIEFSERLQCGGFIFRPPLTPADMVTFFRVGAELKEPLDNIAAAEAYFRRAGLDHIKLETPLADGGDGSAATTSKSSLSESGELEFLAADFAPLLHVYQSLYENVATNTLALRSDNQIDLDQARTHGEELVTISDQGALDVMQFMRYPDFDSYTIGHSVRVAALGAMLAGELGWSRELQNEIATAGLLHDLGKGKVPDEILFKPGRLSSDERKVMETHPVLGVRVLLANGETSPIVLAAAWGHHLRDDGGGYPLMPPWFERSSAAALVHVCDVFEALTAARPYKNPLSPRRAYEIMLADKGAFQPLMLAALIRFLGLYPPGSEVLLTDSRRAVVVAKGPHPEQPLVRVTHDEAGAPISRSKQPALNVHEMNGIEVAEFLQVSIEDDDTGSVESVIHIA